MATAWDVASVGWSMIVLGWLVSPVITLILPKILSFLGFDVAQKLQELEISIMPELENTLHAVDQERMMQRGKKSNSDVAALDKMAALLRHAREDAEDIFDDAQERIVGGDILDGVVQTFKRSCVGIAFIIWSGSARLLQWAPKCSLCHFLQRASGEAVTTSVPASNEPGQVTIDVAASDESVPVTANAAASHEQVVPTSHSSGRLLSCFWSSFELFKHCCTSTVNWLHFYRDWSYEAVGVTSYEENATVLDFVLTAITRWNLKKRIEKVQSTISNVEKSPLVGTTCKSAPDDIANKNRSKIRTASKWKVFGREVLRDDIMAKLRKTPEPDAASLSASQCYSVIGIYGVAGSGKTTFARYVRDYLKEECTEEKYFDTIMCIHVTETFRVDDIFHEMLKDITKDRHSNISDREELEEKLKESLRGKRFFLILDDLWVKNKNDLQLDELISPLNVGAKGSKILVTARTKDAAGALGANELIKMPELVEDQYLKMFMHYALDGASVPVKEFEQVGRKIAKKLHGSLIAAVTVAGRLGANPNISFWKNVAKLDMLNDTMDALWWSYQELNPDIRRCFEFCNIFPRRFNWVKHQLVRLWIAHGFVKSSSATEEMEDVAEGYVQELVSCSFLQPEGTSWSGDDCFRIHDLMHDLLEKVAGSDYFRIENERRQREGLDGDTPQDVRHLFVQNYDGELITKKILGLENLRTLIIRDVEDDTPVEEKVIESICMMLPNLRVLAIAFNQICEFGTPNDGFLVPESITQLKHLRYLAFRTSHNCKVILPSALAKLLHIQLLDFGYGKISDFNFADLINLRNIFCWHVSFRHIGRLSSLQTVPFFSVSTEEGYEIKQLRDLNKIRGKLWISGLENVKSKQEALEANLAAKERLTELTLFFPRSNLVQRCTAEVEAEVLEGLCPPVGLEKLDIWHYSGSRYPDWMVGKLNGGPKDLQKLQFWCCGPLGPGPELKAFSQLRRLMLDHCSWDTLPGNLEHLTSLEILDINRCKNIRSLPTLPQCLKEFDLSLCDDELMKGCQTEGDPNWLKIKHIPYLKFDPRFRSHASQADIVIVPPKGKKGGLGLRERRSSEENESLRS